MDNTVKDIKKDSVLNAFIKGKFKVEYVTGIKLCKDDWMQIACPSGATLKSVNKNTNVYIKEKEDSKIKLLYKTGSKAVDLPEPVHIEHGTFVKTTGLVRFVI